MKAFPLILVLALSLSACGNEAPMSEEAGADAEIDARLAKYVSVRLDADLSQLGDKYQQMIPILIEAAKIMDELFWYEAYGDKDELLNSLSNEKLKQFVRINYGPWDRLGGNEPFLEGAGPKPAGANFYPPDITKEEFEAADLPDKASLYTFLRRNEAGQLITIPYREMFAAQITKAAGLLRQAAALADEPGLKNYLQMRAEALLSDDYQASDLAWMDMKDNPIDVVIGPIETYEDQLFGYKAAHECYILIKDMAWSQRLDKYAAFMPELQAGLPAPPAYKQEQPGSDAQLNAYDVVYYAGDCQCRQQDHCHQPAQ